MNNQQYKEFLVWLINRLKNKYHEDDQVIEKIQSLISTKKIIDERVSVGFINDLCNKHYPGFNFDKTDDFKMGYSNFEKKEIYSLVSSIVIDTINAQT